jgi:predicted metal-binding membrane protein
MLVMFSVGVADLGWMAALVLAVLAAGQQLDL